MEATKVNLDELFEAKKERDAITVTTFNRVLERIHSQIKTASRQKTCMESCWYLMPEIILGLPRYDLKDCIEYCTECLTSNGFQVQYYHPNLLFITWKHWVPDYVRHEYKKKTGVVIDGFGKEVKPTKPAETKPQHRLTSEYKPNGSIYKEEFFTFT